MVRVLAVYREAFSGLPRDLWLLALVTVVNRSGTMVLPFLALYLTQERGLTATEAGQLVGLYGGGSALGAYLGGWLSDRIGSVRAQQASLVLGGLGFVVLSGLSERWSIAVALFFVSTAVDAFRPAVLASFAERAPAAMKARAFALLRMAANLGVGIGPAVGGVLALYSYRWLFFVDAATCWIAALLLMTLPKPLPSEDGEDVDATRRSPWRDGPFLVFLVLVVAVASVLYQLVSTLPLYFREHVGLREDAIGLLLALNPFLIVMVEMVLIHLVENRDRMQVVGAGAFLLCAGYGLVPYGSSAFYLAITIVVWTVGEMLALPVLNVVVAERARRQTGRYMGAYMVAFAAAFIVAPVAGTYAYERFGPDVLWHGIGALGLVLWAGSLALRRPLRS